MTLGGALAPQNVTSSALGAVSLVGGGPGDADLLTVRAESLLDAAGMVVVDAGVAHLAAAFAPRATLVTVPDRAPAVAVLLDAVGSSSSRVVRLYAGDTWLHPAYGPESAALTAVGIGFEAVAGVATEVALPALAGIPVHVRHLAVACTIADPRDAPAATDPARTLVALADDLQTTAAAMAATGDPSLPAAAIETTDTVTRAPLGELAAVAPHAPGVVVTGAVIDAWRAAPVPAR